MGPMSEILCAVLVTVFLLPGEELQEEPKAKPQVSATITDQSGTSTSVKDPRCVRQKKSLFGDSEELFRHFTVQHGEGTIKVDFAKLKSLTVAKVEGDWIHIKMEFHEGEAATFKMKSDLLLRGDSTYGEFEIKMVEVKKISFAVKKAASGG